MRMTIVALLVFLGTITLMLAAPAKAQDDPCAGEALTANEVGLNYQGHCVVADKTGPPVQTVTVMRVEDLDGVRSIRGIVLIKTADGWVIAGQEFVDDADQEVGSSGHLVYDGGQ